MKGCTNNVKDCVCVYHCAALISMLELQLKPGFHPDVLRALSRADTLSGNSPDALDNWMGR